ncbi:MAG: DUF1015 domain-containing protein [Nitrospinota bacterium]
MAVVRPFRGIIYNPELIHDLKSVVAPPYDVIPERDFRLYYRRHGYNVIHLILGKVYPFDTPGRNRYTRAGEYFQRWLTEGVLVRDREPAFYVYSQTFALQDQPARHRVGLMGLVKLARYDERTILPHEQTFPKPKEHLKALRRACKAHLSPVFGVFADPAREVNALISPGERAPIMDVKDDLGARHCVWRITSPSVCHRIEALMADKQIIIVDGHHRYETTLELRDEFSAEDPEGAAQGAYDYVLMFLANTHDEGLTILPTHRICGGLEAFDPDAFLTCLREALVVEPIEGDDPTATAHALAAALADRAEATSAFGLCLAPDRMYLLTLADPGPIDALSDPSLPEAYRRLDVHILHTFLVDHCLGVPKERYYEHISYTRDDAEVVEAVMSGQAQVGVLMNPPTMAQVKEVTHRGLRMPQKSTYFYPKLLTGLVMNQFG